MNFIEFQIELPNTVEYELIIALLSQLPINGMEELQKGIVIYFEEEKLDEKELLQILNKYELNYQKNVIPETNWNASWESNFPPIIMDKFCSIRADFHPKPKDVQYDIVITPKMSFGTGHHATTSMMIQLMKEINFHNKKVFDYGTGTGILAILAHLLGAKEIHAIDIDKWSVENAQENFERNNCSDIQIKQGELSLIQDNQSYDIILANINRNVLLDSMERLAELLSDQGQLLLSGILVEDKEIIKQAASAAKLQYSKEKDQGQWSSILFEKQL